MGEIYIYDLMIAEHLSELGYPYVVRYIDDDTFAYVFYETKGLLYELQTEFRECNYSVHRSVYL